MNIFILDSDVNQCARYHVDKHLNKMIIEHCQMLSINKRFIDGKKGNMFYKEKLYVNYPWTLESENDTTSMPCYLLAKQHLHHPCTVWIRKSVHNWNYVVSLTHALFAERQYRSGADPKLHSSWNILEWLRENPPVLPDTGTMTPMAQAMNNMPQCKVEYTSLDEKTLLETAVRAYRNYYREGKQHLFKWKNRLAPHWLDIENKIIFLDIDGVLNVIGQGHDEFGQIFHKHFEKNLKRIVDETGAKIVISSTWRMSGLKVMREMWKKRKLPGEIVGITSTADQVVKRGTHKFYDLVNRGHEIQQWIDDHEITKFVILDDDDDMLDSQHDYFVQTSNNQDHPDCIDIGYGLTAICTEKAIKILNS
jgi:hypothetical protein